MRDVCSLIWLALIGLFRSRASLQAEILTLCHQLNVECTENLIRVDAVMESPELAE
jgi:hypothetical protein